LGRERPRRGQYLAERPFRDLESSALSGAGAEVQDVIRCPDGLFVLVLVPVLVLEFPPTLVIRSIETTAPPPIGILFGGE
jgi:hypothetical protein